MTKIPKFLEVIQSLEKPTVMYVTGGGTEIFGSLLASGGGSRFFLEGLINYCPESTDELLGEVPDHYASGDTARKLAMKAYDRAVVLSKGDEKACGVAFTAKLGLTHRDEREGRTHDIHFAYQDRYRTLGSSLVLDKPRTRAQEEALCTRFILLKMGQLYNYANPVMFEIEDMTETPEDYGVIWFEGGNLKEDNIDMIVTPFDGKDTDSFPKTPVVGSHIIGNHYVTKQPDGPLIYPGSFNPFHQGHLDIVEHASTKYGQRIWLEISLENTHKPTVDFYSMLTRKDALHRRLRNHPWFAGTVITNKAFFIEKAALFDRPRFIMGSDTFNRFDDHTESHADFLKQAGLVVYPRVGTKIQWSNSLLSGGADFVDYQPTNISSTEVRRDEADKS